MSRFTITDLPLAGLKLIQRKPIMDERGFLARIFCSDELAAAGWHEPVAQINHTRTTRCGTVRGMHFQYPPHAEMKLVSCIRGKIWDVVVDLRRGSPTFLRWHAEPLSAENCRALLVPEGFAHGFQSLTDNVEMLYCHATSYVASAEGGLNPTDPRLAIAWPLPITTVSARDSQHPMLDDTFSGVSP